jgi:hypothetical protein
MPDNRDYDDRRWRRRGAAGGDAGGPGPASSTGQGEQRALCVLVGQRVQRLERARQLGQRQVRDLERQPARPLDRRRLEARVVLGLDHQQDRERVAQRDPAELGGSGLDEGQVWLGRQASTGRRAIRRS